MTEANAWRMECCNRALNAVADNDRCTIVVVVKPHRGRRFPIWTVTVNDKDGRLLAACRHEFEPFESERFEAFARLMYLAVSR